MPAAENAALVRSIFDAFARRDVFGVRAAFAEDAVWVVPGSGIMAGTFRGRTEILRFLARLPRETGGTYSTRLIDVLASDDRAAGLYRAAGERDGRTLDLDQVLLFSVENGLVSEVVALPTDPASFEEFWR